MTLNTYADGDVLSASQLNDDFKHSITSTATSTVAFTPTDATTNVLILAKVTITLPTATNPGTNITLVSDQDGTLDTSSYTDYKSTSGTLGGVTSIPLQYTGTLSAAAHNISISTSNGTLTNIKITILEFPA